MKYGTWKVRPLEGNRVAALQSAGISPLAAALLAARGYDTPEKAHTFLTSGKNPLRDPYELPDMEMAAARVRRAMEQGEVIAVYGDYDVDGITATCLLTDFLIRQGANCVWYIPARLEEGYGLNEQAILGLKEKNVKLIITVDCGITAVEEAKICSALGIELIITDHHECKTELPEALAVVDPHRKDAQMEFPHLAGVGVAFKLAAAISGDQAGIFREYCDLVSLGTVADVMPLIDENRTLVTGGIAAMQNSRRFGLQALMRECQIVPGTVTSSTIGYTLAPRINAAGRMGKVELAAELLLTQDMKNAEVLANQLCRLNRQRQEIEAEIYEDAVRKLEGVQEDAIVLAGDNWHQGVVGIVASRLAEEYGCPVFLICLSGDMGKASSRSYGGFPLFSTLEQLEPLLESFGGHELAAGFTIRREHIAEFRTRVTALAKAYRETHPDGGALKLDCAITPALLTTRNVAALDRLEPFGAGFAKPMMFMEHMQIVQLMEVGGGKHLKLQLSNGRTEVDCIFFSTTACRAAVALGDMVEVAFTPQINEFRGMRSVQLNLTDIRPDRSCRQAMRREKEIYDRLICDAVTAVEADALIPRRQEFAALWRYLTANCVEGGVTDQVSTLARKVARSADLPVSFVRTKICLDVMAERGLLQMEQRAHGIFIRLTPNTEKVNLEDSEILIKLQHLKER